MSNILLYTNKKVKEYIKQDRSIGYWIKRTPYLLVIDDEKVIGRVYLIFEDYYEKFGYVSPDGTLSHFKKCPDEVKMFFQIYHIPILKETYIKHATVVMIEGDEIVFPDSFFEDIRGIQVLKILNTNIRYPLSKDINKIIKIEYSKRPSIKMRQSIDKILSTPVLKNSLLVLPLFTLLYYISLYKKYKNVCLPLRQQNLILDFGDFYENHQVMIHIFDEQFKDIKYKGLSANYLKDFISGCLLNPKKDFIFIPVNLQYSFRSTAHATLLLIDKTRKRIYYFDPWGFTEFDNLVYSIVRKKLEEFFPNYKELSYEFLIPPFYCPYAIFQRLEDKEQKKAGDYDGFCQLWVFWTIEQIVLNPQLDFRDLILYSQQQILKSEKDLKKFIRRYAKLFEDVSDIILKSIKYEKRLSKDVVTPTLKNKLDKYIMDALINQVNNL